ncbi:hypothetical protein BY458DRAFT_141536 [Sporodiniella umbellata]|nr:hypothetical protein BY458DRAFT_141536 [Sporodiniella umbellata]
MSTEITKQDTLIHHEEHDRDLSRVIMVCLDDESAETTFHWALDNFIVPHKDLIVLVHVRAVDIPVAPYINTTGYIDDVAEERREMSHRLLKRYAHNLYNKKIACKAISMVGEPKVELLRKCEEIKTDVVLMGARKMGAIKRTLLGSVSDYLVHHAPCTVIVSKPMEPEHTEERRKSIQTLTSN